MTIPEKRFKAGACTASVFENEIAGVDGAKKVRSVVLQRTYKDKDGKFRSTSSFNVNDVPKAVLVLSKAYEYMAMDGRQGEIKLVE